MHELDDEKPSKSQRKRDAQALFELGAELVAQKSAVLQQFNLPEKLQEAIALAQRTHQHGAKKRQLQYIAKLLRGLDADPIRERLAARQQNSQMDKKLFHLAEQWRERLLREGETAVQSLHAAFPAADTEQLLTLIRTSRHEQASGHPPASARKLFRYLRELLEK